MGLGMSGDADLEIRHPLQAGHQLRGIGITAGVWLVRTAAGSISTEGHDVAHPRLPVTAGDLLYLAAVRAHAGEMGGGTQPEALLDGDHGVVGAGARRASSTIGDGDEARPE